MFDRSPDVYAHTMTESQRETERKYEAPSADDTSWLPDLTGTDVIASVVDQGTEDLDAVYYDTDGLRLARASATLRRRTGGSDAGWHLKLPLSGDSREEVRTPLSEELPDALRELTLSRTRGAELRPVVRIRSDRGVRQLVASDGTALAELSVDAVRAESLLGAGTRAAWTEMEVELAPDAAPGLLDAVEKTLGSHGIGRAHNPSKLARALEETGIGAPRVPDRRAEAVVPGSAGDEILRYVDERVRALVDLDPAVRRDLPDAVHQMRTTCRRLRSVLRSYRSVLDREVTDPVRDELKWLGAELGAERDHEVLRERLAARIEELPRELVFGETAARFQMWDVGDTSEARLRTLATLNSPRHLALLNSLATLTEHPRCAAGPPGRRRRSCKRPSSRSTAVCPTAWPTRWTCRRERNATRPCTKPARPPRRRGTPPNRPATH